MADVSINILDNLPAGDYRISLYVTEDSVTGTGPGYDQSNLYHTVVGNPFYGMGNFIAGYVHKHVARALLPSSWGLAGVIPASPVSGQNFSHSFNHTLPPSYDEKKISLIAFVSRHTANHQGDEVLNAGHQKLLQTATNIAVTLNNSGGMAFPNPSADFLDFSAFCSSANRLKIQIFSGDGKCISEQNVPCASPRIFMNLPPGLYLVRIENSGTAYFEKISVIRR